MRHLALACFTAAHSVLSCGIGATKIVLFWNHCSMHEAWNCWPKHKEKLLHSTVFSQSVVEKIKNSLSFFTQVRLVRRSHNEGHSGRSQELSFSFSCFLSCLCLPRESNGCTETIEFKMRIYKHKTFKSFQDKPMFVDLPPKPHAFLLDSTKDPTHWDSTLC